MFQTELVKSRQFRRYKDTPFVGNCAGNTSHFLFRWRKLSFFFLFNEREGKYGCCTKWRGRFICIGKSSLHFLDVMKHELNSGMFCLCPCKMLQSALTLVRVQACSVWLPWSLFLMEVSIHVLFYVRAVKKWVVHRGQFLISASSKMSAVGAELQLALHGATHCLLLMAGAEDCSLVEKQRCFVSVCCKSTLRVPFWSVCLLCEGKIRRCTQEEGLGAKLQKDPQRWAQITCVLGANFCAAAMDLPRKQKSYWCPVHTCLVFPKQS